MAFVGYARISSVGQSLAVQLDKLAHCDKLFQETTSGAVSRRPQLAACLEYVRDGDTLVVTRLDRLARSTLHLWQIAANSIASRSTSRSSINILIRATPRDVCYSTCSELLHSWGGLRAERQIDEIRKARERGVHLGRHKRLTPQQTAALQHQRQEGALIKTLMHDYRLSKAAG